MILVAGSSGHVGTEVCRQLIDRGQTVRALVRTTTDSSKIAVLESLGAELVYGSLSDRESLQRACAGVDAVISTVTATSSTQPGDSILSVDGAGQLALIDVAEAAAVAQFVFVSFSGGLVMDSPFRTSKRAAEEHLRNSSMAWTILRPTAFMEAWLSPMLGFNVPEGMIAVYGSGGAPLSYISLVDVATFCVDALRDRAAHNTVIELGGPEAITALQAVRIAEDITGRTLTVQHVPEEALRAQYDSAEDPLQKSFAALILGVAAGDVISMSDTLRRFPIHLRTVREFMQQAYGQLREQEAPPPIQN
jgi:uncharacterized protein YbjT (DUF2867 family)